MKIAILSRAPRSYSTQRLRAAAADRGHTPKVLNTLRFAIDLSAEVPDLLYRGRLLSDYDAVIPRIGNSITYYGTAVVRQFEQMDVYTPNTANGISNSRDKLRANQILSRHGIAMPPTAFVLVEPGPKGRRVVLGDCNPGITLLDKVAADPRMP